MTMKVYVRCTLAAFLLMSSTITAEGSLISNTLPKVDFIKAAQNGALSLAYIISAAIIYDKANDAALKKLNPLAIASFISMLTAMLGGHASLRNFVNALTSSGDAPPVVFFEPQKKTGPNLALAGASIAGLIAEAIVFLHVMGQLKNNFTLYQNVHNVVLLGDAQSYLNLKKIQIIMGAVGAVMSAYMGYEYGSNAIGHLKKAFGKKQRAEKSDAQAKTA